MVCEYCNIEYSIKYGSGRFCSSKCARAFSTSKKRTEINEKVSKKLKGKKFSGKRFSGFQRGHSAEFHWSKTVSEERANEIKSIIANGVSLYYKKKRDNTPFEKLSKLNRKRILLEEQDGKCVRCGLSMWLDKLIKFELHHIDGNKHNNKKDNSMLLCPNCHSFTKNWRK